MFNECDASLNYNYLQLIITIFQHSVEEFEEEKQNNQFAQLQSCWMVSLNGRWLKECVENEVEQKSDQN